MICQPLKYIALVFSLLVPSLTAAQEFSLFPQLGFTKGSTSFVDLLVNPAWSGSCAAGSHATGTNTDMVLTLTNSGNDTLEQGTITAGSAPFSLLSTTCGTAPFSLAAGANCTATVRFSPTAAGDATGTLRLTAPNLTNLDLGCTGTGTCTAPSQTTGVSAGSETSSGFTVTFTAGANSTSSSLEYGTTTAYGTMINPATSPQAITGLSSSTLYHYRVNAINSCATTNGADATATTAAGDTFACPGTFTTCEDFDAAAACYSGDATYVNCSDSWTRGGTGTFDFKQTTSVSHGTYALNVSCTSGPCTETMTTGHVAIAPSWSYFRFRIGTLAPSNTRNFAYVVSQFGTIRATVTITTAKKLAIQANGGTGATGTTVLTADTWYQAWVEFTPGAGTNAVANLYLAADGVARPGSVEAASTNGTDTVGAGNIKFQQTTSEVDNVTLDAIIPITVDDPGSFYP